MKKLSLSKQLENLKAELEEARHMQRMDYTRLLVAEAKVKVYERVSMGQFVEDSSRAISTLTDALAHTLQSVQKRT